MRHLKPEAFKRLCGVQPETFAEMVRVLGEKVGRKRKSGRQSLLSLSDQLLMTLEYWREYRTYFHVGQSWGVNESTAYRIIRAALRHLDSVWVVYITRQKASTRCRA